MLLLGSDKQPEYETAYVSTSPQTNEYIPTRVFAGSRTKCLGWKSSTLNASKMPAEMVWLTAPSRYQTY